MKLINTSKVSTDNKITLIKEVSDKLKTSKGDIIGYYLDEKENIVIKKVSISPD